MSEQGIFDSIIDNALKVFRLAAAEKTATFERLKKMEKELVAKMAEEAIDASQRRKLKSFLKETAAIIETAYQSIQDNLQLGAIAEFVAKELAVDMAIEIGMEAFKLPKPDYFNAINSDVMIMQAPSSAWWKGQAEDTKIKFQQAVQQGLLSNETNQKIIQRIVGKNGEPGVMDTARRNAAALVQTSVQAVANDARRETFKANSDVIKGIKQVSTLDSNTSLTCIAYSGCEWDLDFKPIGLKASRKPYNGGTPRHFNCRSVEIPITKTFKELGLDIAEPTPTQRASELGPIEANTNFNDFLVKRGKAYQDEMLGEGRADLWRDGKITLRDLVNGQGRPLSISELQKKFNAEPKVSPQEKSFAKLGFFDDAYLKNLPTKVKQPYDNWDDLVTNGEIGLAQFKEKMGNVAEKLNLRTDLKPDDLVGDLIKNDDGFLFTAPLKGYKRALEKVTDDYEGDWSQVNDVVRGTISVKDLDGVATAIEAMRAEGFDFVARPKDRFLTPVPGGYRDILGLIKLPNGMNAEIQFHVKEMTKAKNVGHEYYEVQRTLWGKYEPDKKPNENWSIADIIAYNNSFENQVDIYEKTWNIITKGKK